MIKMGELIPKLKGRANGPPQMYEGLNFSMALPSAGSAGSAGSGALPANLSSRDARKEAKREEKKANKKKK